jgi:hypothetical protein
VHSGVVVHTQPAVRAYTYSYYHCELLSRELTGPTYSVASNAV